MAWCCQATSHYLSQCWPRSLSPYGITRPQRVNFPNKELCFHVTSITTVVVHTAQHKDVFIPSEYLRHINFIKSCQHGTSILSILQTVSNTLPHFGHTLLKYEWHQLQTCIWQKVLSRKCTQEILLAEIKITGNFALVAVTACTGTLSLTNWCRHKMAAIFKMTFSNAFSWMKMDEFRLKLHWSLFLWVQLIISQHWLR